MGKRDRSLVPTALWLPNSIIGGTTARIGYATGGGMAGFIAGRAARDAAAWGLLRVKGHLSVKTKTDVNSTCISGNN